MKLSSFRRKATIFTDITDTFIDAAKSYTIAYITSLAGLETLSQKILSYFNNKLRSIICDVLNNTSDDNNILQETLEIYYSEALNASGALYSDNYFIPLGKANLVWPYNPNFESEDYYKYKNCIAINNSYTKAFQEQCKCKSEKEQ